MSGDNRVQVWEQVVHQARGEPVSVAHVCAAAAAGTAVDGAGVTLMVSSTVRETVTATDRIASDLEELQLTLGQGPCVDTFDQGGPVLAVDLRAPEFQSRWPAFTPAALESGARAVFAFPVQIGAIRLGVLDLYRTRPGGLSERDLADALTFAEMVGVLLLDGAAGSDQETAELAWQRADPSDHQAVVHQATGMVLVQLGCTAEAAFARLRAYAYAQDRRLGDVARDVVERKLRFRPGADPVETTPGTTGLRCDEDERP